MSHDVSKGDVWRMCWAPQKFRIPPEGESSKNSHSALATLVITLPKANSSPLKIIDSKLWQIDFIEFPFVMGYFQGRAVSFKEGNCEFRYVPRSHWPWLWWFRIFKSQLTLTLEFTDHFEVLFYFLISSAQVRPKMDRSWAKTLSNDRLGPWLSV